MENQKKTRVILKKTGCSLLLAMTFLYFLFRTFYGVAVYQGMTYAAELGEHAYLFYTERYLTLAPEDFVLLVEPDGDLQVKQAAELTETEQTKKQILGKILLHWGAGT